jgi:hypothetical protein
LRTSHFLAAAAGQRLGAAVMIVGRKEERLQEAAQARKRGGDLEPDAGTAAGDQRGAA